MPRRSHLREKSTADPQQLDRVLSRHERLLDRLRVLRERFGRFVDLDELVGRTSGYFVQVFKQIEALPFDRLLMALDVVGVEFHEFAETRGPGLDLPRSASGVLPALCPDPHRRAHQPDYLEHLRAWVYQLELDERSPLFPLDPDGVIELSHSHLTASQRMAEGFVTSLLARKPTSLPAESIAKASRLLTSLGYTWAIRGVRRVAAELLDLAFRLQEQVNDPEATAYTYRIGAHLLADWGHLDDASLFVRRAERLCIVEGDVTGLGRTVYIQAYLHGLRGEHRPAIQLFRASLAFLGRDDRAFVIATTHAIAWSWVQLGDLTAAEGAIKEVDNLTQSNEVTRAHYLALLAEIASRRGERSAHSIFQQADRLFETAGSTQDRLILGLRWVRHHIRQNASAEGIRLVERLVLLANQSREASPAAKATLVELLRLALASGLKEQAVEHALDEVSRSPAVKVSG